MNVATAGVQMHPIIREIRNRERQGILPNLSALLMRHGRIFYGVARPRGMRQRARKQCYSNALDVAQRDGSPFTYVEGFAHQVGGRFGPFEHAWVTRDGIHAVDPTLPDAREYLYFGIPLNDLSIAKLIRSDPRYTFLWPSRLAQVEQILAEIPPWGQLGSNEVARSA